MKLTALYIYPVKGCRGVSLPAAEFDAIGLRHDRRFLIVDEVGRHLTQRGLPQMARLDTAVDAAHLTLSSDGRGTVRVPLASTPDTLVRTVTIWKDTVEADDCGDEAAEWLDEFLGQPARLVRIGARYRRPVRNAPHDSVAFNDAYPLLVLAQESLEALNDRLEVPVPMDRFRPNLVVEGVGAAHAEDEWKRFRVGRDVILRTAGNCSRCIVTTTDQLTGDRGAEPLRTLAGYRRRASDKGEIDFGQNCIHETKHGRIAVGDAVELLPAP